MRAYDIKKKMIVAKYQWGFFRAERDRKRNRFKHWKENQPIVAEKEGLKYTSYEDLYGDYIIGAIDYDTYFRQRKLYNRIIADNWQREAKLAWLEENCDKYQKEYEAYERLYKEAKNAEMNRHIKKFRVKQNGIRRRTYDCHKNISKYNMPKHMKEELKRKEAEKKAEDAE